MQSMFPCTIFKVIGEPEDIVQSVSWRKTTATSSNGGHCR